VLILEYANVLMKMQENEKSKNIIVEKTFAFALEIVKLGE